MTELAHIKNSFESNCSIKIETNSKGHNTTVHVYEGVTLQEIDDTVVKVQAISWFVSQGYEIKAIQENLQIPSHRSCSYKER
jgi:hypothetical protein